MKLSLILAIPAVVLSFSPIAGASHFEERLNNVKCQVTESINRKPVHRNQYTLKTTPFKIFESTGYVALNGEDFHVGELALQSNGDVTSHLVTPTTKDHSRTTRVAFRDDRLFVSITETRENNHRPEKFTKNLTCDLGRDLKDRLMQWQESRNIETETGAHEATRHSTSSN
jgi:hypothetical protein